MVPAGSRMVEGGGVLIPDHGLAVQVMLVPVEPGRPRASMIPPVEGRTWFTGFRTKLSTPQKSLPAAGKLLASLKADDPTVVPDEL
jgi:hypothetical protein